MAGRFDARCSCLAWAPAWAATRIAAVPDGAEPAAVLEPPLRAALDDWRARRRQAAREQLTAACEVLAAELAAGRLEAPPDPDGPPPPGFGFDPHLDRVVLTDGALHASRVFDDELLAEVTVPVG